MKLVAILQVWHPIHLQITITQQNKNQFLSLSAAYCMYHGADCSVCQPESLV